MTFTPTLPPLCLSAGLCASLMAHAGPAQPDLQLQPVTVTGNPLGATEIIAPSDQLATTELTLRAQGTLGDTLDGLPGVSSTGFGPNASRPILRGLDGDRIRILSNGGATLDASAVSYDHAVPLNPLVVERIEVLRGPAALLYGGSAVGGVVNLLDGRIAQEAIFDAKGGVAGQLDVSLASGARERSVATRLDAGNDRLALHADAYRRMTADTAVPVALPCSRPGAPALAWRICNSAGSASGGALGGSLLWDHGFVGASVSSAQSDYGTVAEDAVTIGMRSVRTAVQGEWRHLGGLVQNVQMLVSHTDYRHTEYDEGDPGTLFTRQGNELRLQLRHRPIGPLEGVWGLQAETYRFAAQGDEAFAPASRSASRAVFLHEEWPARWGRLSWGVRAEQVQVQSFGGIGIDRFVPAQRRFTPLSHALGGLLQGQGGWQFTSNLAWSQRAPTDVELFANGPHLATAAWEAGNVDLELERAISLDLGAAWKARHDRFSLHVFNTRFANYIGLQSTGQRRSVEGELNPLDAEVSDAITLPEQVFRQGRARFAGLEVQGQLRLIDRASALDLQLRADLVRARNSDTGEPLPRVAPARWGATLIWTEGPWSARVGFDHASTQTRVPAGERATPGWTQWNASLTHTMKSGDKRLLWYARLTNATDQLAYSASSILTQTAPGRSPLPGRNLKLGIQAAF